jgi:hypothetical protein
LLDNWNDDDYLEKDDQLETTTDLPTTTKTLSIREHLANGLDRIEGDINLFTQLSSGLSSRKANLDDVVLKFTGFRTYGAFANLRQKFDTFTQSLMDF